MLLVEKGLADIETIEQYEATVFKWDLLN